MIELIDAAAGAGALGIIASVVVARRALKAKRDERTQLIAMGEGMGIEYVPGECIVNYRRRVVIRRDNRATRQEAARVSAEERPS